MQLEFHQLDRRWEHLRVRHPARQRRLLASLAEAGQQTPIVVVAAEGHPDRYVVIDGYKRIAALEQLGRDTVEAVVWPMAKFGLSLHPDKTRLIEFGRYAAERRHARGEGRPETFDFLGFTHCCGRDRKGRYQVVRLTVKKRMRATLATIRETPYRRRHEPVPVIGAWLHRVVEGYFRYLAVPTNLRRLGGFRSEVCRAWRHALRRQSQRTRMNWERFQRLVHRYIPSCRVLHPHPEERFFASHPTLGKSRMR